VARSGFSFHDRRSQHPVDVFVRRFIDQQGWNLQQIAAINFMALQWLQEGQ